ncbi:MAG: DUF3108 domain-containing protein [Bacteroidota bacterium]
MKKIAIYFFSFLIFSSLSIVAQGTRKIDNQAFKRGERLEFRVFYDALLTGQVTAGVASLEIGKDVITMNDRPVFYVKGEGWSKGAFNFFFKVEDKFESYFDEESIIPYKFTRRIREGGYHKDEDVRFYHLSRTASHDNKTKKIPGNVQDVISAFYYARTIDFSKAKMGDIFPIPFYLDDSVYTSVVQFAGREVVRTILGEFRCLKFKPMMATGNVFSDPYPMTLWVTDDKNRLPILGTSAVVVGTVKMELTHYSNIANPLSSKTD